VLDVYPPPSGQRKLDRVGGGGGGGDCELHERARGMSSKCVVTEAALVPAVLCALFAILLVPPALRLLASLCGRGDRTAISEPRKAGRPEWEPDDGSRLHPITSFGAWGRADGCLNSPRFLLPVEDGVLVADSGNDRLQIFTADGTHVRTILGSRPGHPTGLATDGTHVWVADSSNCSVSKIMLKDGALVTRTGSYGAGVGELSAPEGLALAQVTAAPTPPQPYAYAHAYARAYAHA
jgi:hypothetical protein